MMKKYFVSLTILILLLISSFYLMVDVPVVINVGGEKTLPLSNKSYDFKIKSLSDFNSISIRLITNNLPVGPGIKFQIKKNKRALVSNSFLEGGLANGEYYKFNFDELPGGTYTLNVIGLKGTPYQLIKVEEDKQNFPLINLKIYTSKSIAGVAYLSSVRASSDWFKLGPLYLISLILYVLIISFLVGLTLTKSWQEDEN